MILGGELLRISRESEKILAFQGPCCLELALMKNTFGSNKIKGKWDHPD
jgi:hypothetical protein